MEWRHTVLVSFINAYVALYIFSYFGFNLNSNYLVSFLFLNVKITK
jgi:hypothetical protein